MIKPSTRHQSNGVVAKPGRSRRTYRVVASATAVLVGGGLVLGLAPAQAAPTPPSRPAIVSPTLDILAWLASGGGPIGCNVVGSAAFALVKQVPNGASSFSGEASQIGNQCRSTVYSAAAQAEAAQAQVAPLAAINPYANQGIEAFSKSVQLLGTDFGTSMAPFGPAVITIGSDARFFEGTGS